MIEENNSLKYYLSKATLWWFVGVVATLVVVFIFTINTYCQWFDYSNTGQIGDTIGGISSPFIGVAAAVLTFMAFYMQFKANEMLSNQFNLQKLDDERVKHEDNILFLIKQNRSIIESMSINDTVHGARCFESMCLELRTIYEIVSGFYKDDLNNDDMANIAYLILFNVVGNTSDELNYPLLKKYPNHDELLNCFRRIYRDKNDWYGFEKLSTRSNIEILLHKLQHSPFEGHLTRLGHYFRNLFHILKYTESVNIGILLPENKYEIIKSLRSQLTSDEQIIIYFNAISSYGTPMRSAKFIEKYQLIKNIPLPSVEFAGNIRTRFPDVEFEWDEIISRASSKNGNLY